jgi:hypothetical protein
MAKKNKHKPTSHELKVNAAHQKNEYMGRIQNYIDLWLGEKSFSLIPKKDYDFIFLRRYTTPRLEVAPGVQMSSKTLNELRDTLDKTMGFFPVELGHGLPEISLKNFLTYFMTIHAYFVWAINNEVASLKVLSDRFRFLYDDYENLNQRAIDLLHQVVIMLGLFSSRPDTRYLWIEIDFHSDVDLNTGTYWRFKLRQTEISVKNITLYDQTRPAFRLGIPYPDDGVTWCWLKVQNPDHDHSPSRYLLYIQSHAILRMFERLESIDQEAIMYNFYSSFVKPEILLINGKVLIRYNFFKKKLGYFLADFAEGKLLIKTFLFVTNEGTPEAMKLQEIAGLGKLDIKYWNIDKLQKFLQSDIVSNPVLKKIFSEAGCSDLFTLETTGTDFYNVKEYIADDIQKYLGLNESEDEQDELQANVEIEENH